MLHRLGKREALRELEELEDVSTLAAAEAVEEALVAVHMKRRRLLAMKRTESFVALAGELERRDLRHEVDNVGCRSYLRDYGIVEIYERHQSSSTATVAPSPPSFSFPGRHDFTAGCLRRCSRTAFRSAPVPNTCMIRTACFL